MPIPEGPVFDGAFSSSQATKDSVALRASATAPRSSGAAGGDLLLEIGQVGDLPAHRSDAGRPEVARVAGQVLARLGEEGGDRSQLAREPRFVLRRQRKGVRPELDQSVRVRSLVRRRVALLRPDRGVEGGIAGPGLEDAQVEVEPVHLGAQEREVDARVGRSGARLERRQPVAKPRQLRPPPLERRRPVVRRAVVRGRRLEGSPVREQRLDRRLSFAGR